MPQDVTVGKKRVPDGDCSESQRTGELHVVSGGQTGVDQAALQAAIEVGFALGSTAPARRSLKHS